MMRPGKLTLLFLLLQVGSSILEDEEDGQWISNGTVLIWKGFSFNFDEVLLLPAFQMTLIRYPSLDS